MKLERLIEEGLALKPRPLTLRQIRHFYYRNRYKDDFEHLWERRKQVHENHWKRRYFGRKLVSYPRLTLSWEIGTKSSVLKLKIPQWISPMAVYTKETRPDELNRMMADYCQQLGCLFETVPFGEFSEGTHSYLSLPQIES